jgi:hypothetical protein
MSWLLWFKQTSSVLSSKMICLQMWSGFADYVGRPQSSDEMLAVATLVATISVGLFGRRLAYFSSRWWTFGYCTPIFPILYGLSNLISRIPSITQNSQIKISEALCGKGGILLISTSLAG